MFDDLDVTQQALANTNSTRGRLVKDKSTKKPKLNCRKYVHLFGISSNTNADGFVAGNAASLFPHQPQHRRLPLPRRREGLLSKHS
jgi:hypothetical protein